MRLIKPLALTTSNVTSNIPLDDAPAWAVGTTYALGAVIYKGVTLYESLVADNVGNDPATTNNEVDDEPKWLVLGAVNRWRMFDGMVGSYTEGAAVLPSEIEVVITFDEMVDSLVLFGLDATKVTITVSDGVLSETIEPTLYDDPIADMRQFYYEPLVQPVQDISFGPKDPDDPANEEGFPFLALTGTITLTIENENRPARCGLCLIGRGIEIGSAKYGISSGILSYSKKITDEFGRTFLRKGRNAKMMNVQLFILPGQFSYIQQILSRFDGEAIIWDANQNGSDQSSFVVYGFSRDFRLVLQGPGYAECSLDLEGLI